MDDTNVYAQRLITPEEKRTLESLLPRYDAAMIPAARADVERMVAKLTLAYPAAKVSDAEAGARLDLYADALADIPADILGNACMAALRTHKFFPSVSEIREGCGELFKRQWRAMRIRHLIAIHDRDWKEPETAPELTDEQRRDIARSMKKLGISMDNLTP